MPPDLVIDYPHFALTAKPRYVAANIVEGVAVTMRQQLGLEDGSRLAVDLERLIAIKAVRVNGVAYGLEWSIQGPLTDENGDEVLGICEHVPEDLPDTVLICLNPDPIRALEEVLLSTGSHEFGHGIFEAPAWMTCSRRANGLDVSGVREATARRAFRTITPDEDHLSTAPPHGTEKFYEEARANAFMGAFLAPSHRVYARLQHHCSSLGVSPSELETARIGGSPRHVVDLMVAGGQRRGNLEGLNVRLWMKLDEVLAQLARDFGVTKRFMEVRLKRYGFLRDTQKAA